MTRPQILGVCAVLAFGKGVWPGSNAFGVRFGQVPDRTGARRTSACTWRTP
ncbi:hypothetical protein ACFTY8_42900 [Streptomyces mirabilis]|uniref:hypothetical protein n=1 Tax=Streptomyces mirabilis TaxID=68239 RepID=UPI00363B556B